MSHTVECRYMSTFQGYSSSKIHLPAENISVCIRTFLSFFFRLSTQFDTEKSYLGGGGIAHWKFLSTVKGWRVSCEDAPDPAEERSS